MGSGPTFIHYLVTRAKRKSGTTSTTELVKKNHLRFRKEGLIVILGILRFVRARLLLLLVYLYILNDALNT